MKKIKLFTSALLCASMVFPFSAYANSLTPKDENIQIEGKKIADKYNVGDKLSETDLKFILDNGYSVESSAAKSEYSIASADSWSIYGMKRSGDNSVEGEVGGSVTVDVGLISVNVYGNLSANRVHGAVTNTTAQYKFVAYGLLSTQSPYVGKVADWTQTASGSTSASVGISKLTYANVSVYMMYPEAVFTHAGGILNVTGTATKQ
ncbi:hypothetical protein HQN87_07470 [Paenibacillus tritici]|uniref:Uncharacterized protein n=1 Tax=Paenibacillus tritici TaxID=1873425 RepID=A0ABX2DLQ3_9BACL|nr:hypothetical protein [Paenibacillus tritici]NQX45167.1 hypothetical protein [Paenibacillus tritici]